MLKQSPIHFCGNKCKGAWMSLNCAGENGYNWKNGSWNNRKQYLAHTSYRTWRKRLLENASCLLCGAVEKLELHHIESKVLVPEKIKDESNVCPICSTCHDSLHSHSRKGGELRERLNAILAHDNPQPSLPNVKIYVGRKVQRLTGEDAQSDKPDTSAAPERDEIVRANEKSLEAEDKEPLRQQNCMIDSKKMKEYLLWIDRIAPDVTTTTDFETYMIKQAIYSRFGYGWTDWRWIYGHVVS